MKKFFRVSLIFLFAFILIGCNQSNNGNNDLDPDPNGNGNGNVEPDPDPDPKEDEKPVITVLDNVSDFATESTRDKLVLESDIATFVYTSSMPDLYVIEDGIGSVNKVEQKHQNQNVTITVDINFKDGTKDQQSKEIVVGPIVYPEMNQTPIASYFNAGALTTYLRYSEHYKATGDLFTSNIKNEVDMMYYAFVNPRSDGTVVLSGNQYELLKPLKANNVRILLVIDGVGQSSSDAFHASTRPGIIDTFVTNIMDLVDDVGFDGVDIDWEPFAIGGVNKTQMTNLMIKLRAEMDERQAEGGSPYMLTAAIPASSYQIEPNFDLKAIIEVADYINFMTYDYHNSSVTGHVTPIKAITDLITYLERSNFPLNQAIMGSGTYGKAYKLKTVGVDDPYSKAATLTAIPELVSMGSFGSGTIYIQAIQELMKDPNYVLHHQYQNEQLNGSYLYNKEKGIYITFESEVTAKAKMDLISEYPGMGIMQWSFAQDANNYIMNTFILARLMNQN